MCIRDSGDKFILDAALGKGEGCQEQVGIDYKSLPQDVVSGDILLLDDGRVQLKVEQVEGTRIHTTVTVAGPLSKDVYKRQALSNSANSRSLSALSTAVWAAAFTMTSGFTRRTVSATPAGLLKSPQ